MGISLKVFLVYLVLVNIYSFYIMLKDKRLAIRRMWRIPEANLFALAAAFGSIGILSGMYAFRHKTKHIKFILGIPLILAVQLYAALKLFLYFH